MATIGRRWDFSNRGDYSSRCDVCGVRYPRSQLRRKPDGLLYCQDDAEGRDKATLARLNSSRGPRSSSPSRDPGAPAFTYQGRHYEEGEDVE